MNQIKKVLVVLASPFGEDGKMDLVTEQCKTYMETCSTNGVSVDFINLYEDTQEGEFSPLYYPGEKDTKVLEYQIRLKQADLVSFFYPVWWNGVPAIMKAFIEKVFVAGFAYHYISRKEKGLLDQKKCSVYAFSEETYIESKFFQNNSVKVFWERGVFRSSGLDGKVNSFTSLEGLSTGQKQKITKKVKSQALKDIGKKEKFIDLL